MTIITTPFDIAHPHSGDVLQAAKIALEVALNLRPRERLLIMANPDGQLPIIAKAVYNAALTLQAKPILLFQSSRSRIDLADPITLAAIATEPDVMFTITRESLGNDPQGLTNPYKYNTLSFNHIFYYLIATRRSRGAWCPCADLDIFRRSVPVDYPKMWERAKRLKKLFDDAESIHVTTPAGTDLFIDMSACEGMLDDGDYRFPGSGGNLPAGEVFTIPNIGSYGRAVIDGTAGLLNGTLLTQTPFELIIEEGKVIDVRGGTEAEKFRASLEEMKSATEEQILTGIISQQHADNYRSNIYNLAEFGIGLNPSAMISGNMTEDEKVLNTCHIAVGDDCYGQAPAVAHLDLIMMNPKIEVIMENGDHIDIN